MSDDAGKNGSDPYSDDYKCYDRPQRVTVGPLRWDSLHPPPGGWLAGGTPYARPPVLGLDPHDPNIQAAIRKSLLESDAKKFIAVAPIFHILFTDNTPDNTLQVNQTAVAELLRSAAAEDAPSQTALSKNVSLGFSAQGGQGVQYVYHVRLGKPPPGQPTTTSEADIIIPVQITKQFHDNNKSGFEWSVGLQAQQNITGASAGLNTQLQVNSSLNYVIALRDDLQLGFQVQLAGQNVWGSDGTQDQQFAAQGGVQIQWTSGNSIFTIQASVGVTNQKDPGDPGRRFWTLDSTVAPGLGVTWNF